MVLIPDRIWFPWDKHPPRTSPPGKADAHGVVQTTHPWCIDDFCHALVPPINQLANFLEMILVFRWISVCVINFPEYGLGVP